MSVSLIARIIDVSVRVLPIKKSGMSRVGRMGRFVDAIEAQGGQTNTHPGAHLMILHGHMRKALDLNCRTVVLGHSWCTNDT